MMRRSIFIIFCTLATAMTAFAQSQTPEPILADSLKWSGPPNNPLLRGAWVLGSEQEPDTYALRVMLGKGGKIPPHTHPDKRYSTVLKGNLYVGFGSEEDEVKMVVVPEAGVYVAPANVPHYLWAKDGDVVYQEAGVGPTATVFTGQ